MKRATVIFFLSIAVLLQINCGTSEDKPAAREANNRAESRKQDVSPARPVTAADLIEAYRRSESEADAQFKGKMLAVSGTVARRGKDYLNRLYVNLRTADNPIIEVHCTYDEAEKETMSRLKEGQSATITGLCEGKLSTMIILKNSVLAD